MVFMVPLRWFEWTEEIKFATLQFLYVPRALYLIDLGNGGGLEFLLEIRFLMHF